MTIAQQVLDRYPDLRQDTAAQAIFIQFPCLPDLFKEDSVIFEDQSVLVWTGDRWQVEKVEFYTVDYIRLWDAIVYPLLKKVDIYADRSLVQIFFYQELQPSGYHAIRIKALCSVNSPYWQVSVDEDEIWDMDITDNLITAPTLYRVIESMVKIATPVV